MKESPGIPSSKVERAARVLRSGLKVGGNYLRHYATRDAGDENAAEQLNRDNAETIYETLSTLKGGALKAAQMLSLDTQMLPAAYVEKFAQAQYQAPALSAPLVMKTLRQTLGKDPLQVFDSFEPQAAHAASMGQVHRAEKDGQQLAVKLQYPGVADSVVSDMNLLRPLGRVLFGWRDRDMEVYFDEVKARLLEEANYTLELQRGSWIASQCAALQGLEFPRYYPELSGPRVLVMSWLEGKHLDEYLATAPSQTERDRAGQAMWNFYNFQVHQLRMMHADAHPGNFLFMPGGGVGVLDFGCVKEIPEDFYEVYRMLISPGILEDDVQFTEAARKGGLLLDDDSPEERKFFLDLLRDSIGMLCLPFHQDSFDFSDKAYFDRLYTFGEATAKRPELRSRRALRGTRDSLYLNRAYFGLYLLLHKLGARVDTRRYIE